MFFCQDFNGDSFAKPRDDDYHKKKGTDRGQRRLSEPRRRRGKRKDHCSALIKLLPNREDVVFGHTTWDDFQVMVQLKVLTSAPL